jgi:uncharacterized repeat protein (TIGR03803 family)
MSLLTTLVLAAPLNAMAQLPSWNICGSWPGWYEVEDGYYPFTMNITSENLQNGIVYGTFNDPVGTVSGSISGNSIDWTVLPSSGPIEKFQFTLSSDGTSMSGNMQSYQATTWNGFGAASGQASPVAEWTENALYPFTGGADGSNPQANLIADAKGNLYGTTYFGGSGYGVIFKLSPPKKVGTAWSETPLYAFTGGADGKYPAFGPLAMDTKGNLYGTTVQGGAYGSGVVYQLTPSGTYNVLYAFTDGADGGYPECTLIIDRKGNLYGMTSTGVVFRLSAPARGGTPWNETVLYTFTGGTDGGYPLANLVMDKAGNLYGTTYFGGDTNITNGSSLPGAGVVFELSPPASRGKPWSESVLYTFQAGADGGYPDASLILDTQGNLYGTTQYGGNTNITNGNGMPGAGVVFELSPPFGVGIPWNETVLYTFQGGADGGYPQAGVVMDKPGNLYGTTPFGGDTNITNGINPPGGGVVYKLTPPPSGSTLWCETVFYNFAGGNDGGNPSPGLLLNQGILYGVTYWGGASGEGAVFQVSLATLSAFTISPNKLIEGQPTTGKITLNCPAPNGGLVVSLISSSPGVAQPVDGSGNPISSITVPPGATMATFPISTSAVAATTPVTFTASANGSTLNATITVQPIGVKSLILLPSTITGMGLAIGEVTLTTAAPAGGITVTLASSDTNVAMVPTSLMIPAGYTQGVFPIYTMPVTTPTTVTVSATVNNSTGSANLTIKP